MARVPYIDPEDVPEEYRDLMNPANPHLRGGDGGAERGWDDVESPRNTHRALANNPTMLDAYRRFGAAVWQDAGFDPRERELVILTVAKTLESPYEWHQHAKIALTVGLPEEEIVAVSNWDLSAFTDRDRALVEYVRRFVEADVDDATHDAFVEHFDDSTVIGVTQLAGYYVAIDLMGAAIDLDFEEEFIGWELENR